jgi:16S rRNA (cytosine1402-N4)-methyltransferase
MITSMNTSNSEFTHIPVMSEDAVRSLVVNSQGTYVDATYGLGGHSHEILGKLDAHGRLYAFDRDAQSVDVAQARHGSDNRFEFVHARFSEIGVELRRRLPDTHVSGIIADLGVSSPQLDNAVRGFSFLNDGPLDMRMNPQEGEPASVWLHAVSEKALSGVLRSLGEEKFARRIARRIVEFRSKAPINSTGELAQIVADCIPTREKNKHPATRTFLAIRMHINHELGELNKFLPQCVELLKRGGRLVVITFHSVEDRIVKRFMREASIGSPGPEGVPFRQADFSPTLRIIGKPLQPDSAEVNRNRRSRSAVMRVAERIG